ncbi:MAG: hypothetical protein RL660_784 [Bacteroidota bacterium]|jgi:hypothetical protein
MRTLAAAILLVFLLASCGIIAKYKVGLSLKPHIVGDNKIIACTNDIFADTIAAIGKFSKAYLLDMLMDSTLYDPKDAITRAEFAQYIAQPLNCLFFDKQNDLVAAYTICYADLHGRRLTWSEYLSKTELVKNITVKQNVTFATIRRHITILKEGVVDSTRKNAVLVWSKAGGRQTNYFLREFYTYLRKHQYNVYVVNCDEALAYVDFGR